MLAQRSEQDAGTTSAASTTSIRSEIGVLDTSAGAVRQQRRWTLGAIFSQMVILSIVGAGAFGVGYFAKEREDLMARERMLERQLTAQDQIAALESQIRELELVQLEEDARRATIVEVDLNDVFMPVREGVARAAVTRFDVLAAGVTAELERLVQVDLLEHIKTAETDLTASPEAVLNDVSVGDEVMAEETHDRDLPFVTPTVFPAPLAADPLVSFAPRDASAPGAAVSNGPGQ